MKRIHEISDNPFYVLDVSYGDSDETVLERAQDLQLLLGIDTTQAVQKLMHPGKRLEAEIGYLPGLTNQEKQALRLFVEQTGREDLTAGLQDPSYDFPGLTKAGALGKMNAVFALLEVWPIRDAAGGVAAALCLASLADAADAPDALQQISESRALGEREALGADASFQIRKALSQRKHQLAALLTARVETLPRGEHLLVMKELASRCVRLSSRRRPSPFLEELVCLHLTARFQEPARQAAGKMRSLEAAYRKETFYLAGPDGKVPSFTENGKLSSRQQRERAKRDALRGEHAAGIIAALKEWDQLTGPARSIQFSKGVYGKEVKELFDLLHSLACDMNNRFWDRRRASQLLTALKEALVDLPPDHRELLCRNEENLRRRYTP